MSRSRKHRRPAASALKRSLRYLTPIVSPGGKVLGYRFNPGPQLRAIGVQSKTLKDAKGRFYTLEEAQAYRDAAIDGKADECALQPQPVPTSPITLRELWELYEVTKAAEIARNEVLPPDRRDEDIIKPSTLKFYRSTIKPWLTFARDDETGADLPAAALDRETIKAEYKNQKARRSHHSAAASLYALQAVFAFGCPKHVPANPTLNLDLRQPKGRLRLGSPEEMEALVNAADAMATEAKLAGNHDRAQCFASVALAIIAALWTAQRQADILNCDLGRQLLFDGAETYLIFARTYDDDSSQGKTGGQAHVLLLPPLAERLQGRRVGLLAPGPGGQRWKQTTFHDYYTSVRDRAAQVAPSVSSFQFRDTRDTAITRLDLAEVPITKIALWSGHSLKRIHDILQKHYLVATRAATRAAGEKFEAWRQRTGVKW
jgi:integrase